MQLTGPPKINGWVAPMPVKDSPLEGTWTDEREERGRVQTNRAGTKTYIGDAQWRGRWKVTWDGISYRKAQRILFEMGAKSAVGITVGGSGISGDEFIWTPRSVRSGAVRKPIDVNGDGLIDVVLQEVEIPCILTQQPSTTPIYRQIGGEKVARLEVEFESTETYAQRAGFGFPPTISFEASGQAGDEVDVKMTESDGTDTNRVAQVRVRKDGSTIDTFALSDFPYLLPSSGDFGIALVAAPDFGGVITSEINVASSPVPDLTFDFADYLSELEDVEVIELKANELTLNTTPSQSELQGIKEIRLNGNAKRGTGKIFVERLDSTIEVLDNNTKGGSTFLAGDWSAASGLNSLVEVFSRAAMNISGTLSDIQNAAPNIEVLRYPDGGQIHDDSSITGYHGMSNLRVIKTSSTGKIQGQIADFDHSSLGPGQGSQALTDHRHKTQTDMGGDFGNLPSWTQSWQASRVGKGINGDLIFDSFDPSNYSNFSSIRFKPMVMSGTSSDAGAKAQVLPVVCANGASSINSYPDGAFIELRTRGSGQNLDGWTPYQQAFRALGVKPNVSWSVGGGVDTSPWNSSWAVAGNVSYPSSSEITVDKPASDGRNDTATDDGSAIPTGSTLPNANGGGGARLHIFEDSPNQSGPSDQYDSATEYVISSVTDNGNGTITFGLSGPSIPDTNSADLDADTRIAFTW